jgi:hypothetical protein
MENIKLKYLDIVFEYQKYLNNENIEIIRPLIKNHELGVKSEYQYIKFFYPNSIILKQRFKLSEKIDTIILKTEDNQEIVVCFDISEFIEDLHNKIR